MSGVLWLAYFALAPVLSSARLISIVVLHACMTKSPYLPTLLWWFKFAMYIYSICLLVVCDNSQCGELNKALFFPIRRRIKTRNKKNSQQLFDFISSILSWGYRVESIFVRHGESLKKIIIGGCGIWTHDPKNHCLSTTPFVEVLISGVY